VPIGAGSSDDAAIKQEDGYLRLTLSGRMTRGALLRALAQIIAETKSRKMWRVLCDSSTVPAPLGTSEKFEVGAELARTADRRMILAVVASAELVDYFFETVARNRGASVRVFTNEAVALQWLFSIQTSESEKGAIELRD
jgi:hypothetical protein